LNTKSSESNIGIKLMFKSLYRDAYINKNVLSFLGLSWSWSYGSWIYNYYAISAYHHWVWILLRWGVLDITLCDKVCQW